MTSHPVLVAALSLPWSAAPLAQVPPHATWLNPTAELRNPTVLQDGDDVHVFGLGAPGAASILHARSRDGGRTWPVREVALGVYGVDPSAGAIDTAAATPGTVLVLANDQGMGPVYWRSADHGTTWSATAPLFTSPYPTQGTGEVALLADGPDVVAIWLRQSSGDVLGRRSVDGGTTWLPQQALDVATAITSGNTLVALRHGSTLDLFWNRNGSGAVHQRSTDGGATWLPAPTVVANGMPSGFASTAASDGTNLTVVVGLPGAGTGLVRSTDGGNTWSPLVIPGIGNAISVAQEGARLVAVGVTSAPSYSFGISVSSDHGATWSATPLLLPSPVLLSVETTVAAGVVYVRFFPGATLGLVVTRDGGVTWQLVGGPVNGGFGPGARRNVHVVLEGSPGTPTARFHAYVGLGSSVLGTATAGTGGLAPQLRGDGLPFQGGATTLHVVQAVGGSVGALAVSFGPPVPVALGSATVWPTQAPIVLAFATGGTPGAGTGSFALPIAVPVAPALVGTSFVSQALVVDGANPDGFTITNALETWLR